MNNIGEVFSSYLRLEKIDNTPSSANWKYIVILFVKVILTTSESLLRWWNIKEAKTIPGTRTVGSAAMLVWLCVCGVFFFFASEGLLWRNIVAATAVFFCSLRFMCAVTWMSRPVCLYCRNNLLLERKSFFSAEGYNTVGDILLLLRYLRHFMEWFFTGTVRF